MIPSVFEVDPMLRVATVQVPGGVRMEGFELLPHDGNASLYLEAMQRILAMEKNPAMIADESSARIRVGVSTPNGGFVFQDRFVRVFRQLPGRLKFKPLFAIGVPGDAGAWRSFVGFIPAAC